MCHNSTNSRNIQNNYSENEINNVSKYFKNSLFKLKDFVNSKINENFEEEESNQFKNWVHEFIDILDSDEDYHINYISKYDNNNLYHLYLGAMWSMVQIVKYSNERN